MGVSIVTAIEKHISAFGTAAPVATPPVEGFEGTYSEVKGQGMRLTPLADQQLSGLLMWVPAALPYLFAALLKLRSLFAGRSFDSEAPR